jgi:hypothetical protein
VIVEAQQAIFQAFLLTCYGSLVFLQIIASSRSPRTGAGMSSVVDLYDSATGKWSAGQLSIGRWNLAAASVGSIALFGGGWISSALIIP